MQLEICSYQKENGMEDPEELPKVSQDRKAPEPLLRGSKSLMVSQ
jgi:hypothetical protein